MKQKNQAPGYKTYILVWLGLLALTGASTVTAEVDIGYLTLVIAVFIASIKTLLVLLYFMRLKYEKGFFLIAICGAAAVIVTIIGLTFTDIFYR